jgi:hypothetical protein
MSAPLVVYFNGTFVHNENGAHARMREQLQWLAAHFSPVVLYSYANHPDCPWGESEVSLFQAQFPNVELVLDQRTSALDRATRIKNACLALAPQWANQLLAWHVKGATPGYDRLRASGMKALFVNYVDAPSQLNGIDPSHCIIETHDLKFLHYAKKFDRPIADLRVMGKLRSEVTILEAAGGLIAIAPPENAMFRLWFPKVPAFYVPAYSCPTQSFENASGVPQYDLLFVGSENHFNIEGITQFLQRNAGWVGTWRIAIAGRACTVPELRTVTENFANVQMLGYVEDLGTLYTKTRAVLSPVEGTGLKMKVIDALRFGKPVFASSHTIQGLPPGSEACVFPLKAENIAALLRDEGACQAASSAARQYAASLGGTGDIQALHDALTRLLAADVP